MSRRKHVDRSAGLFFFNYPVDTPHAYVFCVVVMGLIHLKGSFGVVPVTPELPEQSDS